MITQEQIIEILDKREEYIDGGETLGVHCAEYRNVAKAVIKLFKEELKDLQHDKETTVGLWTLDRDPKNLLHDFWQRSSDACPLECSEAENQEKEFEDFVVKLCYQIK